MFSYWKLRCLHTWYPQTNFPHIVKTFIVALNFTWLYIYQEPQIQTLYSEFPELNLGLSSLAKPPGSFTQDCHHQDTANSSGCLSSRSRAPKSRLVWVRQDTGDQITASLQIRAGCNFCCYYHYSSSLVINMPFVQNSVWHFQEGKDGNGKKNLKLLNSVPYQNNYWERTISSWDRIKEKTDKKK